MPIYFLLILVYTFNFKVLTCIYETSCIIYSYNMYYVICNIEIMRKWDIRNGDFETVVLGIMSWNIEFDAALWDVFTNENI